VSESLLVVLSLAGSWGGFGLGGLGWQFSSSSAKNCQNSRQDPRWSGTRSIRNSRALLPLALVSSLSCFIPPPFTYQPLLLHFPSFSSSFTSFLLSLSHPSPLLVLLPPLSPHNLLLLRLITTINLFPPSRLSVPPPSLPGASTPSLPPINPFRGEEGCVRRTRHSPRTD
jgi:hypothetical protein